MIFWLLQKLDELEEDRKLIFDFAQKSEAVRNNQEMKGGWEAGILGGLCTCE